MLKTFCLLYLFHHIIYMYIYISRSLIFVWTTTGLILSIAKVKMRFQEHSIFIRQSSKSGNDTSRIFKKTLPITLPAKSLTVFFSDIGIITQRARTYSTTSNGSTGSYSYTNHNQHYNTIGHNRHKTSGMQAAIATPTSTLNAAALLRSSSATDVNSMRTPKPRPTLLSSARVAKGSTNSLRKG